MCFRRDHSSFVSYELLITGSKLRTTTSTCPTSCGRPTSAASAAAPSLPAPSYHTCQHERQAVAQPAPGPSCRKHPGPPGHVARHYRHRQCRPLRRASPTTSISTSLGAREVDTLVFPHVFDSLDSSDAGWGWQILLPKYMSTHFETPP